MPSFESKQAAAFHACLIAMRQCVDSPYQRTNMQVGINKVEAFAKLPSAIDKHPTNITHITHIILRVCAPRSTIFVLRFKWKGRLLVDSDGGSNKNASPCLPQLNDKLSLQSQSSNLINVRCRFDQRENLDHTTVFENIYASFMPSYMFVLIGHEAKGEGPPCI